MISSMGSTYALLADLPVTVEEWTLEDLRIQVSPEYERRVTVLHAHGDGHSGVGEDVAYFVEDHDDLQAGRVPLPAGPARTLDEACAAIQEDALYPRPSVFGPSLAYRRWAVESALLDLALRQAGLGLADALGRTPAPLRFVSSLNLGEPPSLEPIRRRLAIDPTLRFKLDPTPDWDADFVAELVALGVVETIDFKGQYGDIEGPLRPPSPADYPRLAAAFPDAWLEDPLLDEVGVAAMAPHWERVTWDAPFHAISDIEALAHQPRMVNVKPSRLGSLRGLLDCYDWLAERGIGAYSGGQFEVGPGRGQVQALASLFHADAPNDIAPSGWNAAEPASDLPTSPLPPRLLPVGFGWQSPDPPPGRSAAIVTRRSRPG